MCLDISFQIESTEDSLYDYLPHLKIDPQLSVDFDNIPHIQAHDRPKTKIIYTNPEGFPYLTLMRWGLLKEYMFKDVVSFKKYGFNSFNARAENILDPKSTWYKLRKNRCLIDTSGIYEHRKIIGWKNKVPYFVKLQSRKRLLIPALYSFLQLRQDELDRIKAINDKYMIEAINKTVNFETGEVIGTYAMITTAANQKMKWIHNDGANKHRMPLFMEPEIAVEWIDPNLTDQRMKEILAFQIPSEALDECPVHTIRTTNPRPDHKQKHEPFNWPGLPPLGNDDPLTVSTLFD